MPSKKKPRSLKALGEKLFYMSLDDPYLRFTTKDIVKMLRIDWPAAKEVKRYAKEAGEEVRVLWGWDPDPEVFSFRVCPHNSPEIAKRMIEYAERHHVAEGKSVTTQVKAAYHQGYLNEDHRDALLDNYKKYKRAVERTLPKINYNDITDDRDDYGLASGPSD